MVFGFLIGNMESLGKPNGLNKHISPPVVQRVIIRCAHSNELYNNVPNNLCKISNPSFPFGGLGGTTHNP